MLAEIALVLCCALVGSSLFRRLGAPGLLGMMGVGVVLGPSALGFISPSVHELLHHFKTVALLVILIRAGLGINRSTLRKIGGPALRMGFIPCLFEGAAVALAARAWLGLDGYSAGMLGFIVAAVSPAVVVPQMLELKASGRGKTREVPTLVLAGASLDDVTAITLFGVFAGLAGGMAQNWLELFVSVPAGIAVGALGGAGLGLALVTLFERFPMREAVRALLFLLVAVLFYEASDLPAIKQRLPIASLLGVMAMGFVVLERGEARARVLSAQFNEIWVVAEVLLFLYIGAEVQLQRLNSDLLAAGAGILALGLALRSAGVALSLRGSALTRRERLFCMLAYLPKATVQAAMGAVPLSLIAEGKLGATSEQTGQTILSLAVLAIATTAPLGALAIRLAGPRLLDSPGEPPAG